MSVKMTSYLRLFGYAIVLVAAVQVGEHALVVGYALLLTEAAATHRAVCRNAPHHPLEAPEGEKHDEE